jgi:hypothetical protein
MDRARSYYDKIFPLACHIGKTQLRYLGHVARRSAYGNCLITKAITTAFIEGTGRSGGPQMDFRTSIRAAMKNFGIQRKTWEKEACVDNGKVWKSYINSGIILALNKWREHSKERTEARRARLEGSLEATDTELIDTVVDLPTVLNIEEIEIEVIMGSSRDMQMGVTHDIVGIVVGGGEEENSHIMSSEIVDGIVPGGEYEERGIVVSQRGLFLQVDKHTGEGSEAVSVEIESEERPYKKLKTQFHDDIQDNVGKRTSHDSSITIRDSRHSYGSIENITRSPPTNIFTITNIISASVSTILIIGCYL